MADEIRDALEAIAPPIPPISVPWGDEMWAAWEAEVCATAAFLRAEAKSASLLAEWESRRRPHLA
jgi:hypothetical protein